MLTKAHHRAAIVAALFMSAIGCGADATSPVDAGNTSVSIIAPTAAIYAGDAVMMRASVRDARGIPVDSTAVTWKSLDPTIAEISTDGEVFTIKEGNARIQAQSGKARAVVTLVINRLTVQQVSVLGLPATMGTGDIVTFGVRTQGEGGRDVLGRRVTLMSSNPAVALIDPSGRVRAVSSGVAIITATVDDVSGSSALNVSAQGAALDLRKYDGAQLPLLIVSDSTSWNGVPELHEVYVESGRLQLSGGSQPRYVTELKHAEYAIFSDGAGQKTKHLRARWTEVDYGVVSYDARGDLAMVSELTAPLNHSGNPTSQGITIRYRIPGDDQILTLLFTR